MNEPMSFLVKCLSTLATPKAYFRALSVAICLVLAWVLFKPILTTLLVPEFIQLIVLILIGTATGSLAIDGIVQLYQLYAAHEKKIEQDKEKLKESNSLLLRFQKVYTHLNGAEIDILRSLTNEDGHVLNKDSPILPFLISNKFVINFAARSSKSNIYKLKPKISNHVVEEWDKEISSNVDLFFSLNNPLKNKLLLALATDSGMTSFEYESHAFDKHFSAFPKCFLHSEYNSTGVLSFNIRYKNAFEKKYSQSFLDKISYTLI
ncbi:hypothetical protein NE897_09870 [Yersinia ruckeri]|uniref:hypothetical protein n=1 Tax=Yersinia ruckeri TaxID=29486 RepID=UPI0022382DA2|nr:hypothetical protein [Yersinia ruckeri]MCW6545988.1 hypothetical protein [Yersinia ruckeri]MCW6572493.1 hypothetical protein [Yersinia ruckeri]